MDYMMPYMDGITTTEKIRALANEFENDDERRYFKSVPIVALSGDSSDKTKDSFFRAGIDDFIEKPVDLKHLKKMLIKWLPVEKLEAK